MPGTIRVIGMYSKVLYGMAIDTTSRSGIWSGLSPFNLDNIPLYKGALPERNDIGANFENVWQFAKVYDKYADSSGDPTADYWGWARSGWADDKAHRYPMGRGVKPLYSLWGGAKLGYIDARKAIYGPLYANAVSKTPSYSALVDLVANGQDVTLRDYDGYDHDSMGMSLTDVLNNPKKKMGHAFVLKALLTDDAVLREFGL